MKSILAMLMFLTLVPGCDSQDGRVTEQRDGASPDAVAAPSQVAEATGPRVVFLGDSLTAGLGLDADEAFPTLLAELLAKEGLPIQAVNAGVSGDTTAGGLARMNWLLRQSPDVVVVGLGANDGLRGLDLEASEENLRQIVQKAQESGAEVLLLGMLIPPNYGPQYTAQFRDLFPRVAADLDVPLVPFMLEGVGGNPRLNQPDGLHPTAEGQRMIARNVLPQLRPLVKERSDTEVSQRN